MASAIKVLWLISSDFWGKNFLSKHNYALAFAKQGFNVYFIEPSKKDGSSITITNIPDTSINLVSHGMYLKGEGRLPSFLRQLYYKYVYRRIQQRLPQPDLLLNFDSINISNLSIFNAKKSVQFFVDLNYSYKVPNGLLNANLLLTVSNSIRQWFKDSGHKKLPIMIGHGLNQVFAQNAYSLSADLQKANTIQQEEIRMVYFGSLFQSILDVEFFSDIIKKNKHVHFDIIGPFNPLELNHGGVVNEETLSFIQWLQNQENVYLHGTLCQEEALPILSKADGFLFLWKKEKTKDIGNSHKMLEYLSFGKAIYSTIPFELYSELIYTSEAQSFSQFLEHLPDYNTADKMLQRIQFALNSTYDKHASFIIEQLALTSIN